MSFSNQRPLKNLIDLFLDNNNLRERFTQSLLFNKWESIMGKTIARYTTDLYIKEEKLFIYISSAPLKQELHISRTKIVKMINKALEREIIREVIIK